MATGTTELAPPNEFGDDRDAEDVARREIESLEALLQNEPEEPDVTAVPEGGRTLYSDQLPRAAGSLALTRIVRLSTINTTAGLARPRSLQSANAYMRQATGIGAAVMSPGRSGGQYAPRRRS